MTHSGSQLSARSRPSLSRWGGLGWLPVFALLASHCLAEPGQPPSDPAVIQASGQATVVVQPDQVRVVIAIVSQEAEASAAVSANAKASQRVEAALRKSLGKQASIEGAGYALSPNYTYVKGGGQTLDGYVVRNRLRVSLNDVSGAGRIIDRATEAGATEIQQVQFALSDEEQRRRQALEAATRDAYARAGVMASALQLKIRRVLSVQDGQAAGISVRNRTDRLKIAGASSAASTSILPGGIEIRATATVEVEVGP